MTNSAAGLRRSSKALPKAKLAPENGVVTGGLLPIWSSTAFWIPAIPLHLRSMLRKSMRCTKNCNASSQDWSTEMAQFFPTTTPDHMSHDQCFKSWTNWAAKFCLICHIHLTSCQLMTTSSSISTTFGRENASTTSRVQKMLSKSVLNPEVRIFMLQEWTNLFLIGKMLIVMVPLLINKDVFEPSYNNLKFTVQNCNYVCTNLILGDLLCKELVYAIMGAAGASLKSIGLVSWRTGCYSWAVGGSHCSWHLMLVFLLCLA